jgi:hypothetical protein
MTSATTSPNNHKLHETSAVVNHKYMTANRKIKQRAYVRPQRQAASGMEAKKLAVYLHTLQKHTQFRQLLTSRHAWYQGLTFRAAVIMRLMRTKERTRESRSTN